MNRLFFIIVFAPLFAFTQPVNVTFLLNTSTVPDTIRSSAFVQMRGNRSPLTQDSTSPVVFNRIAGDYWKAMVQFNTNDTIEYKFFVNGNRNKFSGLEETPNRTLIVGTKDTTLPLQYVFGSVQDTSQYWRPFQETDSIEVLFRVNMEFREDFNPSTMKMGIRGGPHLLDWAQSIFLKRENQHANPTSREYNGGYFWSTMARFPKPLSNQKIEYIFVIHKNTDAPNSDPQMWEPNIDKNCAQNDVEGNRYFILKPTMNDSTLAYKYWANADCPIFFAKRYINRVNLVVDMSSAVKSKTFTPGNLLVLRHGSKINGINPSFFNLTKDSGNSNIYRTEFLGTMLTYKDSSAFRYYYRYVIRKNSALYFDEEYQSINEDPLASQYRFFDFTTDTLYHTFSIVDTMKYGQLPFDYIHKRPEWILNIKPLKDVLLTLTCDLRPAWHQLNRGDTLRSSFSEFIVTDKDQISQLGIWVNGVGYSNNTIFSWRGWGADLQSDTSRKMYDNGTQGDLVANDLIYTRQFMLYKDSIITGQSITKQYKFSIGGYDNEFGSNGLMIKHYDVINDSSANYSVNFQFGSETPWLYTAWNYELKKPTIIQRDNRQIPSEFNLVQNFPNPFNPSTTITFSISQPLLLNGDGVRTYLTVFDLLGREIATLVNEQLKAGTYTITWDARNIPSGVYFYRLQSGNYSETMRMILLK